MPKIVQRAAAIGLFAALLTVGAVAGQRDWAALLPAETCAAVGWSDCLQGDATELLRLLDGLTPSRGDDDASSVAELRDAAVAVLRGDAAVGWLPPNTDAKFGALVAAFDCGEGAPAVEKALRGLLGDAKGKPASLGGLDFSHYPPAGDRELPLFVARRDTRVLVASSGPAAAKLAQIALAGDVAKGTLAQAPLLKQGRGKLGATVDARQYFAAFVDGQAVLDGLLTMIRSEEELPENLEDWLREFGLRGIRSLTTVTALDANPPRSVAFVALDKDRLGVAKLFEVAALRDDDLRLIPKDANWAAIGNWDLLGLWEETRRALEEIDPTLAFRVDGVNQTTVPVLGARLFDDLLGAVGPTWALVDAPDHGGILGLGTVVIVKVRDRARMEAVTGRLLDLVGGLVAQEEDAKLTTRAMTRDGHEIGYVIIGGVPSPFAPAVAMHGDWAVLGLWPQTVAAALRQVDEKTRGPSLLDHPQYKAVRGTLPDKLLSLTYLNANALLEWSYPINLALNTSFVSMAAKGSDAAALDWMKTFPETVAASSSAIGGWSSEADGVKYVGTGSLGTQLASSPPQVAAVAASILLPSLSRAREQARRAVSLSNLRMIGMGMYVHANDNNEKFPVDLHTLVAENILDENTLTSPRDPQGGISYVYILGQSPNRDDPSNVLAYDRAVTDAGTCVLRLDGAAIWMDREEFAAALRETLTRLGRPAEIPAEFRAAP